MTPDIIVVADTKKRAIEYIRGCFPLQGARAAGERASLEGSTKNTLFLVEHRIWSDAFNQMMQPYKENGQIVPVVLESKKVIK